MDVRHARVPDAPAICELVNYHAERGRMLHRSLEDVYAMLREFIVAEDAGRLIGCVAVDIFWADLAEIKSLAVAPDRLGEGIGKTLVAAAIEDARRMGIRRLFALTYERAFFEARGFDVIERRTLPEKVWRECLACPRADACDEIAMMMVLQDGGQDGGRDGPGRDEALPGAKPQEDGQGTTADSETAQ
ncbi:MAG: N-acetyltransferase [Planctomycetes bacterium]|nr:N-acetyltransferase [Planctomycetota bacterium]